MPAIRAADNPALVNSMLARATGPDPAPQDVVSPVPAPGQVHVRLPGGYVDPVTLDVLFDAEIRELNGADEEIIGRAKGPGKALTTILQRGVVQVGGRKVDKDVLAEMLAGDREFLLLRIRIATWGPEVDYRARCSSCGDSSSYELDLEEVPVRELKDRDFTVEGRGGPIVVSLPTGSTQDTLLSNADKTVAELNTLLLADCVQSVKGMTSVGKDTVRALGIHDRDEVIKQIAERSPGPRLAEATTTCKECGEEIGTPMTLADLFRL